MVRHSPLYTDYQVRVIAALCITFPTLVGLSTIGRLWIKGRQKWWWDDLWVFLGTCVMIEQQAVLWSRSMFELPIPPVGIAVTVSSYTQVWLARASLLALFLHIAPSNTRTRRVAQWSGVLFFIFYAYSVAQEGWLCGANLKLKDGRPQCLFSTQIPAFQFAAAMTADLILIALPVYTLRLLRADPPLRTRLRLVFAASAVTTSVSLALALMNFLHIEFGLLIVALLECWVSLLVCNAGILLVPIFRRFSRHHDTCHLSIPTGPSNKGSKSNPIEISVVRFASSNCDPDINIEMGKMEDMKDERDKDLYEENESEVTKVASAV